MNNRNFYIVVSLFIVVGIISALAYFPGRKDITANIKVSALPLSIGSWKGEELEVSEKSYEILETRNLFLRNYKNPKGDTVTAYLIYSEDNRKVSHPPEVCLMGSGLQIVSQKVVDIPLRDGAKLKANAIISESNNRRDLVVYWYKAGRLHTNSYLKQQLSVATGRMFGKRTAGALIRISTRIDERDPQSASDRVTAFIEELYPLLPKYIP
jgi:EpsI family protein